MATTAEDLQGPQFQDNEAPDDFYSATMAGKQRWPGVSNDNISYTIEGYANPEWRAGKLKRVGKLLIAAVMLAFIIFGFLSIIESEQAKQATAEMQIKQAEQRIVEAESRAREAEAQAKVDTELARQDGKTERAQTYSLALVALSAGFSGTMDMLLFLGFMFIAALAIPAEIIFLKRKGWL